MHVYINIKNSLHTNRGLVFCREDEGFISFVEYIDVHVCTFVRIIIYMFYLDNLYCN